MLYISRLSLNPPDNPSSGTGCQAASLMMFLAGLSGSQALMLSGSHALMLSGAQALMLSCSHALRLSGSHALRLSGSQARGGGVLVASLTRGGGVHSISILGPSIEPCLARQPGQAAAESAATDEQQQQGKGWAGSQ